MKTSQLIISVLATLALSQTACTAKIDGGTTDLTPEGSVSGDPALDVARLNGTWSTGCHIDGMFPAMESTFKLQSGNFESVTKIYKSQLCTEADLQDTQSDQGTFVIERESVKEPGSYEVKINKPREGYTEINYDLVRLDNDTLYFGDVMAPYDGYYPSKTDTKRPFKKQVVR